LINAAVVLTAAPSAGCAVERRSSAHEFLSTQERGHERRAPPPPRWANTTGYHHVWRAPPPMSRRGLLKCDFSARGLYLCFVFWKRDVGFSDKGFQHRNTNGLHSRCDSCSIFLPYFVTSMCKEDSMKIFNLSPFCTTIRTCIIQRHKKTLGSAELV